jgi:hypothetical protein
MIDKSLAASFRIREIAGKHPVDLPAGPDELPGVFTARARKILAGDGPPQPGRPARPRKAIHRVPWQVDSQFELAANESHDETITARNPGLLLARALWSGSREGVGLAAHWGQDQVASGQGMPVPPRAGTVLLRARVEDSGRVVVSVTNSSDTSRVAVRLIAGLAPLARKE